MSHAVRAATAVVLLVIPAAALAATDGPPSCTASEWPQWRQNPCGTATNDDVSAPTLANVTDTKLRWNVVLPAPVGNPIVSGGLVYVTVGEKKRRLNARDIGTGRYVWSAITGIGGHEPIVDDGVLLRLSELGALRRYDPRTGRIIWRRSVASSLHPVNPQLAAGGVLYQSQSDRLVAVDVRRGVELWQRPLGCFRCQPAVAGNRIYATGNPTGDTPGHDGRLYAIDTQTHRTVWSARGRGKFDVIGTVIVAGGRIVVVSFDDKSAYFANAFSAADGHTLWITQLGTVDGFWPWTSAAAGAGIVLFAPPNGLLYAVDQRTGALRWTETVGDTDSSPAIANGLVWLVDGSGRLVAISAESGKTTWRSSAGGLDGSPAVADGLVIVPGNGRLVAYGPPG
jgi:outer membrane protein assembly factor BamB